MFPTFVHKSCQQPRIPTTQRWFEIIPTDATVMRCWHPDWDGEQKIHVSKVRKLKTIENTTSELHRTSKIIQKVFLSRNLHEFEENGKMVKIFLPKSYKNLEIQVDLRSDNDIWDSHMNEVIIKPDKVVVGSRWYICLIYGLDNDRQRTRGCPSA